MARHDDYSQHFLRGPRLVSELVGHSNIRKNDTVYDLGAGSGVIASVLARRAKHIVAVEIEPDALEKLHANVGKIPNVEIIEKSFLDIYPDAPYKIFANIPFHLSSKTVQHFIFDTTRPKSMYLIVQKQFARKLVPGDDHFTSQLSAEIAPFVTVRIRKPLRKTDFTPPPAVDTVLIELKQRDKNLLSHKYTEGYRLFIHQCFTRQKYFISLPRESAGISSELRPSQLTVEQWLTLYNKVTKNPLHQSDK